MTSIAGIDPVVVFAAVFVGIVLLSAILTTRI
jgi:hypothetical protein